MSARSGVELNAGGHPEFDLLLPGGNAPDGKNQFHVASRLIGAHHVGNLLAAAAAAHAAGIPGAQIAASLSVQAAASRWRMERTERADGVTVITMPTTRTRNRCGPRCAPSRTWAADAGPGRCWAPCSSWGRIQSANTWRWAPRW